MRHEVSKPNLLRIRHGIRLLQCGIQRTIFSNCFPEIQIFQSKLELDKLVKRIVAEKANEMNEKWKIHQKNLRKNLTKYIKTKQTHTNTMQNQAKYSNIVYPSLVSSNDGSVRNCSTLTDGGGGKKTA